MVTAETLSADLSYLVDAKGHEISALVVDDPNTMGAESDKKTALLIAPLLWTSLSRGAQANPRVVAANNVINADDMTAWETTGAGPPQSNNFCQREKT